MLRRQKKFGSGKWTSSGRFPRDGHSIFMLKLNSLSASAQMNASVIQYRHIKLCGGQLVLRERVRKGFVGFISVEGFLF